MPSPTANGPDAPSKRYLALSLFTFFLVADRSRSLATSYLFSEGLQPSSVATTAAIIGVVALIKHRFLLAGCWLALAGYFHANCAVLFLPATGLWGLWLFLKSLQQPKEQRFPILFYSLIVLIPQLVALWGHARLILQMNQDPWLEASRQLFFYVRAPHHYSFQTIRDEAPAFLAWFSLSLSYGLVKAPKSTPWFDNSTASIIARLRQFSVLCGLFALAALGFSAIHFHPGMQLFAYRLAPFMIWATGLSCIAAAFSEPYVELPRKTSGRQLLQIALILSLLAFRQFSALSLLFIELIPLFRGPAKAFYSRLLKTQHLSEQLGLLLIITLILGLPLFKAALSIKRLILPSAASLEESTLAEALKERVGQDELLLSPPELGKLRLLSERAIVVDWKSPPLMPTEMLEWKSRISDLCGPFDNKAPKLENYHLLNAAQLRLTQEKYHWHYALLRQNSAFVQAFQSQLSPEFADCQLRKLQDSFPILKDWLLLDCSQAPIEP